MITVGGIPVEVERKKRKTMCLKIVYGPRVIVSVPQNADEGKIKEFLLAKQKWLSEHYEKVSAYPTINLHAVDGQTVRVFGEEYTVKSVSAARNEVRIENGAIVFYENGKKSRDRLFYSWLTQALTSRLNQILSWRQQQMGLKCNGFVVRKQKSRWGWCDLRTGTLGFNLYLAFQPQKSVESVVVHELAHLKYRGHGKMFYSLVYRFMPDYKEWNKRLVMPALSD